MRLDKSLPILYIADKRCFTAEARTVIKRLFALIMSVCILLTCGSAEEENNNSHEFVYGYSELGRELVCHVIGDEEAEQSLLMIFGVHGFEDSFDHDGVVLRMIAERVIVHYSENPTELAGFCLYVVTIANPDGLIEGSTKDGFGRCNANGMDINRDFPVNWRLRTEARNKTGKEPFSTAEARGIRDLVEMVKPTYAMDIHGWISASYGEGRMARTFARPFGFEVKIPRSGGMLCSWLSQVTKEAIMLELPARPNEDDYVIENSAKLIEGVNKWIGLCTPDTEK